MFPCRKPFPWLASGLLLLAGCAEKPPQPVPFEEQYPDSTRLVIPDYEPVAGDLYASAESSTVEVMRAGRYRLVSTQAREGQVNLLSQIVRVRIPATLQSSVEEGLHYTLDRSGYRLCSAQGSPTLQTLFSRPLPAAHYDLGPMPLHAALQVLGSSSYQLLVDPVQREVCFGLRTATIAQRPTPPGASDTLPPSVTTPAPSTPLSTASGTTGGRQP
ncbi:PFGI-1 class ICE element type IV pilus protein PilL2 [Azotobacter vinelandii]|uniref:PFGI-1 class ICE element type IV pilus protein PilL2 n=1 Tax=Azotobacter vinelandii TaxID=354 RepID=UPI0007741AE0|nr:hypothetical protein [Azotobacter vinelandii]